MSGYRGNTAIDHWATHNEMTFSTRDKDNDRDGSRSCLQSFKGAHWYNACYGLNPTGQYKPIGADSMNLWDIISQSVTVKEMTLKVKNNNN